MHPITSSLSVDHDTMVEYLTNLSETYFLRAPPHHCKLKSFFQSIVLAVWGIFKLAKHKDIVSIPG